jgi:DNA polymerase-3 subunit delta'
MMMSSFIPTVHPWNKEIWQHLTNQAERSNHALLFTGDSGMGKQALAMALSHFVLCKEGGQSESLFNAASHPDFHVLMAESDVVNLPEGDLLGEFAKRYLEQHGGKPKRNIGIEQIRVLGQALTTHPHLSSHRVILIVGAELMNRNAANALLKSLEEPPSNTLFIIVSNEISRLPKTVRSRCSLISFRPPDFEVAKAWLEKQGDLPPHEVTNHLAMANNSPLLALQLHQSSYIESLKLVFTDVNGLWNRRRDPVEVAKNWQSIGAKLCIEILQKLSADLLRSNLSEKPINIFFPVQETWVKSSSSKLQKIKILDVIDSLNYAKQMLNTTVDELLVLETVSCDFRNLVAS